MNTIYVVFRRISLCSIINDAQMRPTPKKTPYMLFNLIDCLATASDASLVVFGLHLRRGSLREKKEREREKFVDANFRFRA